MSLAERIYSASAGVFSVIKDHRVTPEQLKAFVNG